MKPEQVVINILVIDGDKKRSQRNALLNKNFKIVGLLSGKHDAYGQVTALIFCINFHNSYDSDASEYFREVRSSYSNFDQNKNSFEKQNKIHFRISKSSTTVISNTISISNTSSLSNKI